MKTRVVTEPNKFQALLKRGLFENLIVWPLGGKSRFCRGDIARLKMCNTFGEVARAKSKNRRKLDIVMKP